MSKPLGPQATNTSAGYQLVLSGTTSLATYFSGAETFSAKLWPGGGYAVLATLTAAWDPDAALAPNPAIAKPIILLTVATTAVAAIAPGLYEVQVIINPSTDHIEGWSGTIRLTTPPGVIALPQQYAARADMEDQYPALAALDGLPGHPLNFVRELKLATEMVNRELMGRAERDFRDQLRRHGPILEVTPFSPTTGVDGGPEWGPSTIPDTSLRNDLLVIRAALDAGALLYASYLDGGQTRRITALLALHLLFRNQFAQKAEDTPYQALAKRFRADAIRAMMAWTAYLDIDADAVADRVLMP